MSTTNTQAPTSKVVIGPVRFSYLNCWEPKAIEEGQAKKYSASLIIPKTNKALIAKITAAINVAKEAGKTTLGAGKIKIPLRDGDVERPEDETYKGCFFIAATSHNAPSVVGLDRMPLLDKSEAYSGMYGYASVNFYAFNKAGNKGIACGLNHIMKTEDGEPLSSRSTAEDDFADIEM